MSQKLWSSKDDQGDTDTEGDITEMGQSWQSGLYYIFEEPKERLFSSFNALMCSKIRLRSYMYVKILYIIQDI